MSRVPLASLLCLGLVLGMAALAAAQAPSSPRLRHTLNEGWRYAPGPLAGAEAVEFADSGWTPLTLPHTWNAEDAFDEVRGYRRGEGWYRRRLVLDPALERKRIFLHFEGANQLADVWVNGRHAGRHVGGYTAFAFDVTQLLRFDAPNLLAVRVDNRHDDDIPPLNADFTFYGGIYRDVWLIAAEPMHVTLLDHASPGVFIDTPEVSAEAAVVRVRGTVANATASRRRVRVVNRVLDSQNREVAALESTVSVPAHGEARFEQRSRRIREPRLWSPEEPNLHRVRTEVYDGRTLVDRVENPLGFRWFSFDAQNGFSLNGRPLRLFGTNRHQDREGYGNALPDWTHRTDVRLVKETGFEFLRLAHYPQDPAVLEETDRQGLVVWEEIPVVNLISMSEAFAENAERMLVEMIRQHYNHPSVLMWGYMNEVMLTRPQPTIPEGYYERIVELARRLEARAKAEDPTRATVTAISFDEIGHESGFQDIPDVLGLNLYFGWYYRELGSFGAFVDSLHARHPERPLLISEYGAGSDERIHTREPRAFDFSTEHQQRFHESHFRQMRERPYLVGTAVWNHFDFGSEFRNDSKPTLNQKGLLYFDRTPKDVWHFYRAALLEEPVLHLATRDGPRRAGSRPEDRAQPVKVYANLDEVELFLGERSLGAQRLENHTAVWTVPLEPGENVLRARGIRNGAAIEDWTVVHYTDRGPFFRDPAFEVRVFAVNAGSHYQFVDESGTVWEADRAYEPGGWGHVGGEPARTHHRIHGSSEDPLVQTTREGVRAYRFDVPDGVYDVRLVLAEIQHEQAGQRVFTVEVNGQPVFTHLDLAGEYGRYVAVEREVRVAVRGGEGIVLQLNATVGHPTVSGIRLYRR